MTIFTQGEDETDVFISKTRKKKDDHALQMIGVQLVDLPEKQLEGIDLPDNVRDAVLLARKTTAHGARKRQLKYIGSLLRKFDTAPIEVALNIIARGDYGKALAFKKLETWRDQLRAGDMSLVNEILTDCPRAERQQLGQLARNAKKEFKEDKGVKASRALFRYLKDVSAN